MNSKRKGKDGELEWANFLKEHGIEARRGQQFRGTKDSPDVISSLDYVHFEVKRVENLNIHKAMDKALTESQDKIPVVAHRKNRTEWLITIRAEDWVKTIKQKEKNLSGSGLLQG